MTVDGGTATVQVGNIASGSGSVGGSITLTEINSSGITGSVTVDAAAVSGDAVLSFRWPAFMRILRDQTSPPTSIISTAIYNGGDTGSFIDPDTLDAGTYYYAFQAISDTDDIGDKSTPQTINVTGAPDAPDNLAYVSGDAAATLISWEESETVGATYNIYVANPDDPYLDTTTPTQTAVTGSTGAALDAITGYPGTAQVLVRAEFSGTEELNGDILFIEYDSSGVYVDKRPNIPSISSIDVASGLQINVAGNYNPSGEEGEGASLQLFIRDPDGSYDFTTPDDTVALGTSINGYKFATLTASKTIGWYYVTLKAITSTGVQCTGQSAEVAVYVSDLNAVAPTGSFTLTRG